MTNKEKINYAKLLLKEAIEAIEKNDIEESISLIKSAKGELTEVFLSE